MVDIVWLLDKHNRWGKDHGKCPIMGNRKGRNHWHGDQYYRLWLWHKEGQSARWNAALKILEWTDVMIRGLLTKALPPGTYDVTIQPKGASAIILENAFTVMAPEIDSVDPANGTAGDEVTINGYFFGGKKGKVTLGGKNCKVISWTMDSMTGAYCSSIDCLLEEETCRSG